MGKRGTEREEARKEYDVGQAGKLIQGAVLKGKLYLT